MIKTPETNISWEGVEGWVAAYHQIFGRRHTSLRYRQLTNHRQALTKDVVSEEQDIEALEYITQGDERYFSGSYYGSCSCPRECRCEFTNSRKWWGELQCYAHNRIQCLTFPTRKTIQFMSQTYMTTAFKQLFEAIKERAEKHSAVKVNFVKQCLKRVNPKVMTIMNIAQDMEWKFLPKPDDAPERGSSNEAQFIADTKDRYYKQWLERVKKGEFDGKRPDMHIGEDAPEDETEEVDMAALARAEKEKAKEQTPVAIVNESKTPEDEGLIADERSCDGTTVEDELPKETKVGSTINYEMGTHSEMRLLDALSDFVTRTAVANDSPPEDTPLAGITEVLSEVLDRLDKLEKKQKSLFNAMRDL